jgi:hypothetical protein
MQTIYNKPSSLSSNPLYKDISFAKKQIFSAWKKDCAEALTNKKIVTPTCDGSITKSESPLTIFIKDNNEIISSVNDKLFLDFGSNSNYQFDNKNFCDISMKNLKTIDGLCSNGLAFIDGKTSSQSNGGVSGNRQSASGGGSSVSEGNNSKSENKAKGNNSKSSHTSNTNLYDRGESMTKGEAVGSGLLSSLKYGIDTWRNFNQIKSFNQGMMNNAYVVRNAELNPPRLSFNPAPNNYPPAMYTGLPLGYMNPYSSTFNYNNNSFYFNTYDPTSGTSLSNDTGYSFSR